MGEGVLYRWLHEHGYQVTGIVEPGTKARVARKLKKHGLPVNLVEAPLWDWNLKADLCVSQGAFQNYRRHEIELILKAMLNAAPNVYFSVPTVHYPKDFGPQARMRRRARWQDMLEDFEYEVHYYGESRRYLWVRVYGLDQGKRATTVVQDQRQGRIVDDTWHPNPWERADGLLVRGEPI